MPSITTPLVCGVFTSGGQHFIEQWVQVGADYALITIATGVIAQLVLSSR